MWFLMWLPWDAYKMTQHLLFPLVWWRQVFARNVNRCIRNLDYWNVFFTITVNSKLNLKKKYCLPFFKQCMFQPPNEYQLWWLEWWTCSMLRQRAAARLVWPSHLNCVLLTFCLREWSGCILMTFTRRSLHSLHKQCFKDIFVFVWNFVYFTCKLLNCEQVWGHGGEMLHLHRNVLILSDFNQYHKYSQFLFVCDCRVKNASKTTQLLGVYSSHGNTNKKHTNSLFLMFGSF